MVDNVIVTLRHDYLKTEMNLILLILIGIKY